MSLREPAQLCPVKRLFETGASEPEDVLEHFHMPALAAGHDLFHVALPAGQANHLRALADSQGTIAVELIQRWVSEQLDQHDIPGEPPGGQHYPSNVIRLPNFR